MTTSDSHPQGSRGDQPLVSEPITPEAFRAVMGTVTSQVTVVTTMVDGKAHGTTVSAFSSLSLDPPMVLVALDIDSQLLAEARQTGRIGINLLGHGQHDLALAFAKKGDDKFADVAWSEWDGLPHLDGAPGWLACDIEKFVDGGDHVVLFSVVRATANDEGRPLIYGKRLFGTHSELPQDQPAET